MVLRTTTLVLNDDAMTIVKSDLDGDEAETISSWVRDAIRQKLKKRGKENARIKN